MAENTILTPDHVTTIMLDCLFRDEEIVNGKPPAAVVTAEGIQQTYVLHPGRVAEHAEEIAEMLDQLPDQFKQSGGGGWSFLNACAVKDPDDPDKSFDELALWTGMQPTVEQLMCLGIATGRVKYTLPREMWPSLPGGMPYFQINDLEEVPNA